MDFPMVQSSEFPTKYSSEFSDENSEERVPRKIPRNVVPRNIPRNMSLGIFRGTGSLGIFRGRCPSVYSEGSIPRNVKNINFFKKIKILKFKFENIKLKLKSY